MSHLMNKLDEMLLEEHDLSKDSERIAYIKKALGLKDHEKIKNVSDNKIIKMLEMNGYPAKLALERYSIICENEIESLRIKKILKMLNVRK
jgi:hypothetical protein